MALLASMEPSWAAYYDPHSWYLSGGLSFDVVSPSDLNQNTSNIAPLQGLIGGRARIERGLSAPDWSHWAEFGYFTGSTTATDDTNTKLGVVTYSQSVTHLAAIPLGATYWFARTAYIDFGALGGLGLAFSPSYTLSATPVSSGTTTTTQFSGGISPIFTLGLTGRFWMSKYLAATLETGLRYYSTTLTASGGSTANAALTSISMIGGLTFALGGVKGTGRNFVEVIHTKPDANAKIPVLKPAPAPSPVQAPAPTTAPDATKSRGKKPAPVKNGN